MSSKTYKDYKGMAMEGLIATWYAKGTQKSIEEFKKDAKRVAENVSAGAAILELAPGPGYLAIELAKLGNYTITGLDISQTFVDIAQANAQQAGVEIDFRLGSAQRMPFDDQTFDFIVCRAAFKNFSDPALALDEMHRVLKAGGKALIIDLRADASEGDINQCVDNMGLGILSTIFTKWTFKYMLIKRAYTKASLEELVSESKFKESEIHKDLIGLAVWLEK
jgi:ubiquinone/menaquinone biosynthesis C-methylase UbiE